MSLVRILLRNFGMKSNRSNNPSIKLNIELTHCNTFSEFIEVMQESTLEISQKSFSLRILARIMNEKFDPKFNEDHPIYKELCKQVAENINNFKSLQMCDVVYWLRVFRNLNLPTINREAIHDVLVASEKLATNNNFTNRQLVCLYHDFSVVGLYSDMIREKISTLFINDKDYSTIEDIKQFILSTKTFPTNSDQQIILKIIEKYKVLNQKPFFIKHLIEIIRPMVYMAERLNLTFMDEFFYESSNIILKNLSFCSESDIGKLLIIQADKKIFPDETLQALLEKIRKNLSNSSERVSSKFLSSIYSIIKLNFPENEDICEKIIDLFIDRIEKRSIEPGNLSRFCSEISESKDTVRLYSAIIKNNCLKWSASKKCYDTLIYASNYEPSSVLEQFKVAVIIIQDTHLAKFIAYKPLKTLIIVYYFLKDSKSPDSIKYRNLCFNLINQLVKTDEFYAFKALESINEHKRLFIESEEIKWVIDTAKKSIDKYGYNYKIIYNIE
jgi:hypothetical protein